MKKLLSLILCIVSLFSLPGCTGIFTNEYVEIKDYVIPEVDDTGTSETVSVANYNGLKTALTDFVMAGANNGKILFDMSYECDPVQELNSASWELRTKNPLFQYCVNGINYDVSKIVAYYEASVYFNYSIPAETMDNIINIAYFSEIDGHIREALSSHTEKLTVNISNSTYTEEQAISHIKSIFQDKPLLCVYEPEIKVDLYSGTTLQKLYEIKFDYKKNAAITELDRNEIENLDFSELLSHINEGKDKVAYNALEYLCNKSKLSDNSDNNSLYSALIEKKADSEGYALAYKYLCSLLDIECYVVYGQKDKEDYCWNIIGFDDMYFHVDPARCIGDGNFDYFLLSDKDIWGNYRWNTYMYKVCQYELPEPEEEVAIAPEEEIEPTPIPKPEQDLYLQILSLPVPFGTGRKNFLTNTNYVVLYQP